MTDAPTASVRLLVVDAVVIPMADDSDWFRGWLAVGDDGRIAGLGPGEPPAGARESAAEVLDVAGAFVAPGFISAHSHLFTSGMRGMTPGDTLYGWVGEQSTFIAGADEEDVYWFTLHGCLDFLGNGVTSAYNFTDSRIVGKYEAATDTREIYAVRPEAYLHRQIDAARDAGLRTMNAIRLDSEFQPVDEAFEVFERAVGHLKGTVPDDLDLGASVFGAVQWSATEQSARDEVRAMDAHGIGNQAHFLETSEALDQQREKFRWYEQAGALRPGFLFGHFVHPDAYMSRVAAEKGAGMVWQPTSSEPMRSATPSASAEPR
ncbi:MAG: amidohydrolase family protein, partial [Herbiconiux sp.]|nr:amidohydrolase family protein [Herbiconiux sp.]